MNSATPTGTTPSRNRDHFYVIPLQLYAIVGGLVSLLGWIVNAPRLADWFRTGVSIQPNTTIVCVLGGVAVLLQSCRPRIATLLGICVAAIAGSAVLQHLTGIDLGTDSLLRFGRSWGSKGSLSPGRMVLPTGISWTLLGIGIALASQPAKLSSRQFAAWCAIAALCIAALSLLGYLYGAVDPYTLPRQSTASLQTATFILGVSYGLFTCCIPSQCTAP